MIQPELIYGDEESLRLMKAAFLVRIPVAILMRRVLGTLFGIGLGVPVATVFQILACFVFLGHLNRKQLLKQPAR